MKNVGHTSEFFFSIYWWTWKTTIYLKKLWSEAIKNNNFNIYDVAFVYKNKEKHLEISLFYTCEPKILMMLSGTKIYSSWDIECDGLKLVIFGQFLPFYSPENPKNQNYEKTIFCHFESLFALPPQKIKILKNWKKQPEMLSFYTCAL